MGIKWSLIQVPDHQGVFHVGGRLGAALGPEAFVRCFDRLHGNQPEVHSTCVNRITVKELSEDVKSNHEHAANTLADAMKSAKYSVFVGGGHDHGYSQLLGIRRSLGAKARIGCINIDAHLDLRKPNPLITSGSPFYLALENGIIRGEDLFEFGIQSHCNRPELWEFARKHGVNIVKFEDLRRNTANTLFQQSLKKLSVACDVVVVSLDLDAAAECYAPGVSAPQSEGFTSSEVIEFCEIAGSDSKTLSLGIFELNPVHDLSDRTARLGATAAHHFISSILNRG